MIDAKFTGDVVAHFTVGDQVEVVGFDFVGFKIPAHFHPAFGHGADGAAGAVFENETGDYTAAINDGFDVINGFKGEPLHKL